jgi:predicted nucleic acid-binding protein
MSVYWDSSALVEACIDERSRMALAREGGSTRTHAFAEIFSTLTGGRLGFRSRAEDAALLCCELANHLQVIELSMAETLEALDTARGHGVRGGLVHDLLHAAAAKKAGASKIYILNLDDFKALRVRMKVELPPS